MWFDQSNEVLEFCRTSVFAYILVVLMTMSPTCLAAKEFSAFRLQQFELHGTPYGNKFPCYVSTQILSKYWVWKVNHSLYWILGTTGSLLNLETRILPGSPIVASPRRCYVVKIVDLTISVYRDLIRHNVGGIVIIIPADLTTITGELKEQIQELEQVMLDESTSIPVYFIRESKEVMELYEAVRLSSESFGTKTSATQSNRYFKYMLLKQFSLCFLCQILNIVIIIIDFSFDPICYWKWCSTGLISWNTKSYVWCSNI